FISADSGGLPEDYYEMSLIEALHTRGSQLTSYVPPSTLSRGKLSKKTNASIPFQRSALAPVSTVSTPPPRKLQRKHQPRHIDVPWLENQLSQQLFERLATPSNVNEIAEGARKSITSELNPTLTRFGCFPWEAKKF